jgi:glycosyltransferase involved in cell wall biosynthesis
MSALDVDVVITSIGRESLRRAVESILAQTVNARAVIVVDRPERKLDDFYYAEPRVQVVTPSSWLGPSPARNLGIDRATADIVAFLDDDDWWESDHLEQSLACVDTSADFMTIGSFWFHDGKTTEVLPRERPSFEQGVSGLANYIVVRRDLRFGRTAVHGGSTLVVSRRLAAEVRWDEEMMKFEDWDFAIRLFARLDPSAVGWVERPTVHVQKGSPGSLSKRMDWSDPQRWMGGLSATGRARADFLYVHALRAALTQRSMSGVRAFFALRPGRPHVAAAIIGLSGLVPRR